MIRKMLIATTLIAFLLAQNGEAAAQALAILRPLSTTSAPSLMLRRWPASAALAQRIPVSSTSVGPSRRTLPTGGAIMVIFHLAWRRAARHCGLDLVIALIRRILRRTEGDPRVPETDLSLNVPIFGGSLDFTRVYDSQDGNVGSLGMGWRHSFESRVSLRWAETMFFATGLTPAAQAPALAVSGGGGGGSPGMATLSVTQFGGTSPTATQPINPDILAELRTPDGRRLRYTRNADGSFAPPVGETGVLTMSGSTTTPTGYTWTLLDKTIYQYDGTGKLLTITDRNGNVVTLDYSGGLLSDVKDPNGRILYTFAYSGQHLASVTDLAGRAVNFTYNGGGQLAQAVGPKGTTSYGYSNFTVPGVANVGEGALVPDASFTQSGGVYVVASNYSDPTISLLTSVTSPNGFTTTFTLGAPQNVVDYTAVAKQQQLMNSGGGGGGGGGAVYTAGTSHPTENKGYYTPLLPNGTNSFAIDKNTFAAWYYPQKFWTLSESGPLGTYSMNYTIDELLEQGSTVVTDPRGFKTTHKWKTINGQTVSTDIIDPDNADTAIVYDAQNNPAQVTDRAGRTTATTFDAKNNPTKVTDPAGQNAFMSYEPTFNGLASFTDPKGNSSQFSYDAKGNLTRAQDAQSNAVSIAYDAHGLPATISDPLNHAITLGRDTNGNPISISDPLSRTMQAGYDSIGRVASLTDPAGKATSFQYDVDNDLTQVKDALNGLTNFDYVSGQLTSGKVLTALHDAKSQTTTFGRDARGRLSSVSNALGQARNYQYDDANNVTQLTKPDGTAITFQYDNLGRLTGVGLPGDPVTNSYDVAGNLVEAADTFSDTKIGYDALNRPVKVLETNKAANLTSEIDYAYDANGNRAKMTLQASPTPFVWTYAYDSLNRVTSITNPFAQTFTFQYDAAGRRTSLSYPNGILTSYTYDAADQVISIIHRRIIDQSLVASYAYTYDVSGNRLTMTDLAGTHSYTYDNLNRLISASHPVASGLPVLNETFSYDAVSNRTADALRSGYTYDAANRLQSDSSFTYTSDANGNTTSWTSRASGQATTLTYDAANRVTGADGPGGPIGVYKYDAAGRRIDRVAGGNTYRYIYDGANILAVLDGNNNLVQLFTQGPGVDAPLSMRSGGQDYFYHQDALGDVTALTSSSGTIVETVAYEAYGRATVMDTLGNIYAQSTVGNPFLFARTQFDPETGNNHAGFREQNPDTGEFIQEDSISNTNQYAYASNNPIRYLDPYGLSSISIDFLPAGWGGGLTYGKNPGNGSLWKFWEGDIFVKIRLGVGEGGGLVYDPYDTGPIRRSPTDVQVNACILGNTSTQLGPFNVSAEKELIGVKMTLLPQIGMTKNTAPLTGGGSFATWSKFGLEGGIFAGGQLTFY